MRFLIAVVALLAAVALAPSTASATDWTDCADAYRTAPIITLQGCRVTVQNVPDLDTADTSGPLGFRYKRSKSKWCRIRAECPKFSCDGPLYHERGVYGSECRSPYKATMTRVTASIRLGDAGSARWCPTVPWKKWYIATACRD